MIMILYRFCAVMIVGIMSSCALSTKDAHNLFIVYPGGCFGQETGSGMGRGRLSSSAEREWFVGLLEQGQRTLNFPELPKSGLVLIFQSNAQDDEKYYFAIQVHNADGEVTMIDFASSLEIAREMLEASDRNSTVCGPAIVNLDGKIYELPVELANGSYVFSFDEGGVSGRKFIGGFGRVFVPSPQESRLVHDSSTSTEDGKNVD